MTERAIGNLLEGTKLSLQNNYIVGKVSHKSKVTQISHGLTRIGHVLI